MGSCLTNLWNISCWPPLELFLLAHKFLSPMAHWPPRSIFPGPEHPSRPDPTGPRPDQTRPDPTPTPTRLVAVAMVVVTGVGFAARLPRFAGSRFTLGPSARTHPTHRLSDPSTLRPAAQETWWCCLLVAMSAVGRSGFGVGGGDGRGDGNPGGASGSGRLGWF